MKPTLSVPLFSAQHVTVMRDGVRVLDDVSVEISEGSFTAIVGPNGGGKTTLLRVLLGLLPVTKGRVRRACELSEIGYVPQRIDDIDRAAPLSVEDIVRSGGLRGATHLQRLEELLFHFELLGIRSRRWSEVSGGQRQRALLARALMNDPKVLVLDEPTSFVDQAGEEALQDMLTSYHKSGMTILLVTHDEHWVEELATQTICVNKTLNCSSHPQYHHAHHTYGK